MKKHIFGLMLFSFIVSAAAVVYAVFNVSKITPAYKIVTRKITRNNAVEIKQAVFDVATKNFSCELYLPEANARIDLHFFKNDDKGAHYLTTEKVSVVSASYGFLTINNSYDWLNSAKSLENIYVIPQLTSEAESYEVYGNNAQPKFDATKAIPVTIDYGK